MSLRAVAGFTAAAALTVVVVIAVLDSPTLAGAFLVGVAVLAGLVFSPARLALATTTAAALVVLVAASGGSRVSGLPLQAFYVLAAFVLLVGLVRARKRLHGGALPVLVLVFFGYYAAVSLFSPGTDWFYAAVALVAAPAVFASASMSRDERQATATAIIWVSLIAAVGAIWESFIGQRLIIANERLGLSAHAFFPGAVRAELTFGQPLVLAFLLVIATALVVRSDNRLVIRLLLVGVLSAGIVATGSASMLVVAAVVVLATIFGKLGTIGRLNSGAAVLAAAAVILIGGFVPQALIDELGGVNAAQRLNSVSSIGNIFQLQELPRVLFGNGWNSAPDLYQAGVLNQSRSYAVDNQIVTTLADTGLIGLGLLVAIIIAAARRMPRAALGTWLGILLALVAFDVLLWVLPTFLAVVSWAEPRREQDPPRDAPEVASPRRADHQASASPASA